MNVGRIIAEIEWLEHLLTLSDDRTRCSDPTQTENDNEAQINDLQPRLPGRGWLEQLFNMRDNRPSRT
jgi:hypothetical protein